MVVQTVDDDDDGREEGGRAGTVGVEAKAERARAAAEDAAEDRMLFIHRVEKRMCDDPQ